MSLGTEITKYDAMKMYPVDN